VRDHRSHRPARSACSRVITLTSPKSAYGHVGVRMMGQALRRNADGSPVVTARRMVSTCRPRWLLRGVNMRLVNFRDLGRLPLVSGGRFPCGRLFLSGTFSLLTPGETEELTSSLGLATLIDLRTRSERECLCFDDEYMTRWRERWQDESGCLVRRGDQPSLSPLARTA
jgi:hypothetical protein